VHLSLIDGSAVTEASNVREFEVSPDRRWIIWQDTEITDDDPEWPSGPVYLRDRMSATTLRLDDAALAGTLPSSFSFIDRNLVRLRLGYLYEEPERAYLLPSLQSFEFPLDREPLRAIGDRFLVEDFFGQSSLEWFDPVTGATEVFFESGGMMMFKGDGFEILEGARCCIEQDLSQRQSKLWYVPITGDRQLLAHRATMQYASLSDRRLITTLDVDDDRIGDLIAVDPDSLEERLVDERVIWSGVGIADDDTMLYAVDDDERTGVWLARLTPLE
jgi:hypothetical protein